MSNNRKVRVAITHGDTNGIGYELIFKAFEEPNNVGALHTYNIWFS